MKKLCVVLMLSFLVYGLAGCANGKAAVEQSVDVVTESGSEQQETVEVTKEVTLQVTDKAVSAKSVQVTATPKAEAVKPTPTPEVLEDGLASDIDRDKIIVFDEPRVMYAQTNVNKRIGPSKDYESLGNVRTNTELKVLGRYGEQGWFLVENGDKKAFMSDKYLGDEQIDLEALRAEQEAAALAAIQQQQQQQQQAAQANQQAAQEQAAQPVAPKPVAAPAGILFIGDSRCVQMQAAVGGGNSSWICENSKGYAWLEEKAIGQADQCVGKGTKVVICLGVNDTDNLNNYATLINAKAAEWAGRGAKTYFVSVNPVTENPYRTEEEVEAFNAALPSMLSGVKWIDTFSFLTANGYRMVDGLHYDNDTYVAIFNAIVGSLK